MARRLSFRPFFGPLRLRPATYWGTPLFCYAETVTCVTGQTSLMEACREVDRAGLRVDDRLGTEAVAEKQSSCIFIAFICVLNLRPFAQPPQKKHFHFRQQSIFFIEKSILFYRKHRQFIALPNLFVKLTLFVGSNSIGSSSGRAPIPVLHRRRTLLLQVPNPDTGTTDIAGGLFSLYSFGKSITFRGEDTSTRNDQRKFKKKNIKTNIRTQIY